MPLQIEVDKVSVSEQMDKMWNIALKLTCWLDGVTKEYPVIDADGNVDLKNTVIYRDISIRYREGQDIDAKRAEALEKMQELIDDYKAEQVVFGHAKMDSLVTYLESGLVG